MDTTIKTLDIQAKEWWDKVNGNSYFSAQITTNFGLPDAQTYYLPFQYGYGDHYVQMAKERLQFLGLLDMPDQWTALWAWCKDNGVILRTNKVDKCKQSEVKEWGKDPECIYRVSYKQEGYNRRQKSGNLFDQAGAEAYAAEINAGTYTGISDAKVVLA